jgi:CHAT domain-containing protein/tetratricopeptide (TPR) repeat protein
MDSPNGKLGPEILSFVASTPGRYTLEVSAADEKTTRGFYSIRRGVARKASVRERRRVEVEILFVAGITAKDPKTALIKLEAALDGWRELSDPYLVKLTAQQIKELRAKELFREGEELYSKKTRESLRSALTTFEKAKTLYADLGNEQEVANILGMLAYVSNLIGEPQRALKYFQEALPIQKKLGDRNGQANTLTGLGFLHHMLGDSKKALEYLEQSLALSKLIGDKQSEASSLNNLGAIHWALGNPEQALKYFNDSLPLSMLIGDKSGEATTLMNIGRCYKVMGNPKEALKFLEQALTLSKSTDDKNNQAAALTNIGSLFSGLGEDQRALKYYEESLSLSRITGDKNMEAVTLTNIGTVYWTLDQNQKALKYYEDALSLSKALNDKASEATTLNNIGAIYQRLGNKQKALEHYEQTLSLSKSINNKGDEALALSNLGRVYSELNENQKSLESYREALVLWRSLSDKRGETFILNNLMEYWSKLKNPRLAIFFGKQCVKNYQRMRSSIQSFDKPLQLTFLRTAETPYRKLANLLMSQGSLSEAHQILNRFRDQEFYDYSSRRSAGTNDVDPRHLKIEMTNYEDRVEQTFISSLDTVVSLRHQVELSRSRDNGTLTDHDKQQRKSLEDSLANASREFQVVFDKLSVTFQVPLPETDRNLQTSDTAALQTALRELSQQTRQKVVAVYTVVGVDEFSALIVTDNSITAVSSDVKGKELNAKALQFLGLLQSDTYDPTLLANELYKIVFQKIADKLPEGTKTIMWSLDGNLRYIPIAALYDGKQYLVERIDSVLFTRTNKEGMTRPVSSSWIGYGFVSSAPHQVKFLGNLIDFPPLEFGKDEMQIFRTASYPQGIIDGEVFPETQFTKATLLAALKRRRPVVHISSHFRFLPGDDSLSFLLLGDGSIMTLSELKEKHGLFEGVELLTLSACNTAAQRPDADGREVDGFAELAQSLGANSVIASLWEVLDRSTSRLMKAFYRNRLGGSSKAEALRNAQIDLLHGKSDSSRVPDSSRKAGSVIENIFVDAKYRVAFKIDKKKPFAHPYYWAPFVLFGNWK